MFWRGGWNISCKLTKFLMDQVILIVHMGRMCRLINFRFHYFTHRKRILCVLQCLLRKTSTWKSNSLRAQPCSQLLSSSKPILNCYSKSLKVGNYPSSLKSGAWMALLIKKEKKHHFKSLLPCVMYYTWTS